MRFTGADNKIFSCYATSRLWQALRFYLEIR